jgi:hypothetical protein
VLESGSPIELLLFRSTPHQVWWKMNIYIHYEGLNTILPRIRDRLEGRIAMMKALHQSEALAKYQAQLEVVNSIEQPKDVYELRGSLIAEHAVLKGFNGKKSDLDLVDAKLKILDEIEGIDDDPVVALWKERAAKSSGSSGCWIE